MPTYRLLGPLEVVTAAGIVRPVGRRQQLLLGALTMEPDRTWSGSRLSDVLWPDAHPHDPPAALRSQVSRLRRMLADAAAALVTDGHGYRLDACGDVDHLEFRRRVADAAHLTGGDALAVLESALDLWRGRPLDGIDDVEPFRTFAIALGELHLGARWRRADVLREVGRVQESTSEIEVLVEEAPDHEGVRLSLARSLYDAGRAREALRELSGWRRHLADEYGLDSSPGVAALEQEILRHERVVASTPAHERGDRLVGRDDDVSACVAMCGPGQVATLVGPGGVGKTRLAHDVARILATRAAERVTVVDVSTLSRSSDVVRAVANAFAIEDRPRSRLADVVTAELGATRGVLVLDGCEHHLEATATLLEAVAERDAPLVMLATSRERLGVRGERVWNVEPLATAPSGPAVELFLRRFRAANPGRDVLDVELDAVTEICRRLDGLPLAIELAAVAGRAFALPELLQRLDERFALLVGGPRHRVRHRTLRAIVDSSYDALDADAQAMLAHLALFAGEFDTDAALAVGGADAGVLWSLVDRSLLSARHDVSARFSMLDTIRAYGVERLRDSGRLLDGRRRHGAWAVRLAEQMHQAMSTSAESEVARRLMLHLGDLRAAHVFLVGDDPAAALRLTASLRTFALTRATSELYRWAEVAVANAASLHASPELAAAWNMVAAGAWRRGDLVSATDAARAAMTAAVNETDRRHGDEATAEIALLRGDADQAVPLYCAAAELARTDGDGFSVVWDVASAALAEHYARPGSARANLLRRRAAEEALTVPSPSAEAFVRFMDGELDAAANPVDAESHLRAAIDIATHAGSTFVSGLAEVALAPLFTERLATPQALDLYEAVIGRWHAEEVWSSQWITLRSLIDLLSRSDQNTRAAVLWGAERARCAGAPAYGRDASTLARVHDDLVIALGPDEFQRLTQEGAELPEAMVVDFALDAVRSSRDQG